MPGGKRRSIVGDMMVDQRAAKQSLIPDLLKAYEVGERMDKALVVAAKMLTKKRTALASYRVEGERLATEALNKLRKG